MLDVRLTNEGSVEEMNGGAPVTQEIIMWTLLAGLVGLIWVMALAILGDNHHAHDNRRENASPEHSDGYKPNERSPRHSSGAL